MEALYAEILQAGPQGERLREVLTRHDPEDSVLISLLRRALPVRFLELVGTTHPWSERANVLAAAQPPRRGWRRSLQPRHLPAG